MEEKKEKYTATLRSVYSFTHLGITFAASILIFTFIGKYFDGKLGTDPYLMMLGAFLGAAAGFYYIIREVIQRSRSEEEQKEENDKSSPTP